MTIFCLDKWPLSAGGRLGGWAGSLHECHLRKASENFENQGGDDDDDDDESGDEVGCTQKGYVRREVQMGNWNGSLLKLAVLPLFSDFSNVYPPWNMTKQDSNSRTHDSFGACK